MSTEIQVRAAPSLEPTSIAEAITLAKAAVASRLYAVQSPEAALMILLTGRDLGLTASQSLRAVYVVSGKPVVSADAMVAAVRRSGWCDSWRVIETSVERCTIETKRRGEEHAERETFSLEDAKRARLDTKDVWKMYPRDMLRHRCAAGLARRVYPDVILGCYVPGELDDARPDSVRESDAARTVEAVDVEALAEAKYASGPPVPQAPPADGRYPRTAPEFKALLDALETAVDCPSVVGAWIDHGATLAQAGSDVLALCKRETLIAWQAFGGKNADDLGAAITAARTKREPKPASDDRLSPDGWRDRIAEDTDAGHIAGGYHKRRGSWSRGEQTRARAITVDRLCVVLATDEHGASSFLSGCEPKRK